MGDLPPSLAGAVHGADVAGVEMDRWRAAEAAAGPSRPSEAEPWTLADDVALERRDAGPHGQEELRDGIEAQRVDAQALGDGLEADARVRQPQDVGMEIQGRASEALPLPDEDGADAAAARRIHDAPEPGTVIASAASGLLDLQSDPGAARTGGGAQLASRERGS